MSTWIFFRNNLKLNNMKISYRNYPILKKLHEGKLGLIPFYEADKNFIESGFLPYFGNTWEHFNTKFKKSINIITDPFQDAELKARPKLLDLIEDILGNDSGDLNVSGTFIIGGIVFMIHFEVKKNTEDNEMIFYGFTKEGIPIIYYINSYKLEIWRNAWISSVLRDDVNKMPFTSKEDKEYSYIYSRVIRVLSLAMFKKYAEVETKYLPANKVIKDVNCKYVNDTKLGINVLDSKWFTNLVKSEGFNVRGHFRLQPKKKAGVWIKELIWISEFQKTGYTAKARILSKNAT